MNSVYLEKYFDNERMLMAVEGSREKDNNTSVKIVVVYYPKEVNEQGDVNENYEDELPGMDEIYIPGDYLNLLIGMLEKMRDKIKQF